MSISFRHPRRMIPPFAARFADGRPVLAQSQITTLTERILAMTSAPTVYVQVTHTARILTRIANGQVLAGDDGDTLAISIGVGFDNTNSRITLMRTNQLDDSVLQAVVHQCEAMDRERLRPKDSAIPVEHQVPDTLVPVQLWHDDTIRAMATTRGTVIPEVLASVRREQFHAAGFLGFVARSEALVTKDGVSVYSEETDSEVTVTARSQDGGASGWGGQAARNWAKINPAAVAAHAIETAKLSVNPVAFEPGRRTVILSPAAVVQLMRFLYMAFEAGNTDAGIRPFSDPTHRNKLGQRVFDPRINMHSDPNDPEGGYRPYFGRGYSTPAMSWVERGILKNLAYDVGYANWRGKRPYADVPQSIRISGGTTSIEEMIAQCKEGIYVNRFSGVDLLDQRTGLLTGVTRDGCFLVTNGKIDRALKNFRFVDSPCFFLNTIEALGVPERAAFGYAPPQYPGADVNWPLPPIIIPPMMVRDFNFTSLSDAV